MVELSIEELKERWELLIWYYGIEKVLVTEKMRNKTLSYEVTCISMEIDGNFVMCLDQKQEIKNNLSFLMMFFKEQCTKITLIPIKTVTGYMEILEFGSNGFITLETV